MPLLSIMEIQQPIRGLTLLGQDVETSAIVHYQLRFQLDVINLALVLNFNINKILVCSCAQTFFKYPTYARHCSVFRTLKQNS